MTEHTEGMEVEEGVLPVQEIIDYRLKCTKEAQDQGNKERERASRIDYPAAVQQQLKDIKIKYRLEKPLRSDFKDGETGQQYGKLTLEVDLTNTPFPYQPHTRAGHELAEGLANNLIDNLSSYMDNVEVEDFEDDEDGEEEESLN